MERYNEYKDSGVQWLGEIPSHWKIEPFGRHFKFRKGLPITKADLKENGIAVISYGQIHAKNNLGTTLTESLVRYVSQDYLHTHPQCLLTKNDFVFADTSEDIEGSGNFVYNDFKDDIFAGYHTIVARQDSLYNPKYYAYLFMSDAWKNRVRNLVNGVKVYSIGRKQLKDNFLLFPLPSEQDAIVDFLDKETFGIDKAIAMQQKMIDLLNERKQIIIQNAVTKGLDGNVEMKDSGVEWIGLIPAHWEVYKLKYLINEPLKYGANEASEFADRSCPRYIRITDIDSNGKLKDDTFRSLSSEKAKPYMLKYGDLLFARSGATVGKAFLFEEEYKACYAGYLIKASLNQYKVLPKFLYLYTQTLAYQRWKESIFIQATIQNINGNKYGNMQVAIPSIIEQNNILNNLLPKLTKFDKVIDNCQRQISLLQERKQIIINEVVTGKVRVS